MRASIRAYGPRTMVVALALGLAAQPVLAQDTSSFFAEGADVAFGLGARHIAMGGTGTATADDAHAIYYNAANLAWIDRPTVSITRQLNARLRPYSFAGIAAPLPLPDGLGVNATIGFAAYPRVHARSTGAFDENDPESVFLRYLLPGLSGTYDGEIDSKTIVYRLSAGLGFEAIEGLSLGVNIDRIDCQTNSCGVHAGSDGYEVRSVHATGASLGFSISYQLGERLRLAAAVSDINTVLDVQSVATDDSGTHEVNFQVDLPRRTNIEAAWQARDWLLLAAGYQSYAGRYGNYDIAIRTVHAGAEIRHGPHFTSRYGLWAPIEITASNKSPISLPAPFAPTLGLGWQNGGFSADLAIYAHPIMSYHLGRPAPTAELSLTYRF